MFIIKEKKKKSSAVKIVLIIAGIFAALAAVGAVLMLIKNKFCKDKQIEAEIDAAINAAFAEEDTAESDFTNSEK